MALFYSKEEKHMKFVKKIVSAMAICGLVVFNIPFSTIPASADIFYTLNDGVLTIKSQGSVEYNSGTKLPWYDKSDQITSIVLQSGVTKIGDSLFSNLPALETVDFPDTLISIGTNSFRGCSSLKSIELPSSLDSIGIGAFGNCTQLQSAKLSDGLESIESWAFSYCPELSEIQLPETLTELGSAAFYECSSLPHIVIPKNVTELNEFTFVACSALEDITIEGELTYLGGGVFNGTKWFSEQPDWIIVQDKFLQTYVGTDTELVIPNGIEFICDRAFTNKNIQSVILSDSVKSIGSSTFASTDLETIDLNQVETIGESAFNGCKKLVSLTIPNTVTSIGGMLTSDCSSLTNLQLSNSITSIPRNAFYKCTALVEINIPDSVTEIGRYAFSGCDSLEKIWIPESVVDIEDYAMGYTGSKVSEILTIYGNSGSAAESYANKNNIAFVAISYETVEGDVNNDGTFTIADVVLLQKWILTKPDATLKNWKAGDLCEDNIINVFDLCLMKQNIIDKIK